MLAWGPTDVGEHAPQSAGQLLHVSLPLQNPSPHEVQAPQSAGQLEQLSVPSQTALPQV